MPSSQAAAGSAQQAGVLEADVGQLPQHVVAQHEPAVVARRSRPVGLVDPDEVVGRRGAGRGPAPIHTVVSPHAGARRTASAATADAAGATTTSASPARAAARSSVDGLGAGDADRRQGPLAHHDRVHELDGHVAAVLGPLRRQAPQGGAGGEAPGQAQRGAGEVGAGVRVEPLMGPARGRRLGFPLSGRLGVRWDETGSVIDRDRPSSTPCSTPPPTPCSASTRTAPSRRWNRSAERILGWTDDEVVGRPAAPLFPARRCTRPSRGCSTSWSPATGSSATTSTSSARAACRRRSR